MGSGASSPGFLDFIVTCPEKKAEESVVDLVAPCSLFSWASVVPGLYPHIFTRTETNLKKCTNPEYE